GFFCIAVSILLLITVLIIGIRLTGDSDSEGGGFTKVMRLVQLEYLGCLQLVVERDLTLSMKSGIVGDISKMCEKGIDTEIECDIRVVLLINNTCLKIVDTEKKAHCILTTDKQTLLGYYKNAASGWIYLAGLILY
ncbi:MAG: hypothetical protein EZS28_030332, partial [Streblomastix strix]